MYDPEKKRPYSYASPQTWYSLLVIIHNCFKFDLNFMSLPSFNKIIDFYIPLFYYRSMTSVGGNFT